LTPTVSSCPASFRGTGLAGSVTIAIDRQRAALQRDLADILRELEVRAGQDGVQVLDLQLVAQVCAVASYPAWKAKREQAWRRQGGGWTTALWPAELSEGEVAVLLMPLLAGRVGTAVGRYPRCATDPVFRSVPRRRWTIRCSPSWPDGLATQAPA
jgi:hypothetical protein